ncbi:MAG: protein Mom [Kofleriaceae bacterium]
MTELLVAPCDFDAAKYAVMRWHYSRAMPAGKLVKFGVWESGRFVGVVLFGRGANNHMAMPYGLDMTELAELVRVALTDHVTPVTQIVAEALRQLRDTNPGLRLVISFADPDQDHHGGIYQAGNWIYTGMSISAPEYIVNGRRLHGRTMRSQWRADPNSEQYESAEAWARAVLDPAAHHVMGSSKFRYLMPLDRGMRRQIEKLRETPPTPADLAALRQTDEQQLVTD